MAEAICIKECYAGPANGKFFPNQITDLDPRNPVAIHFKFTDPAAQAIRNTTAANIYSQVDAGLESRRRHEIERLAREQEKIGFQVDKLQKSATMEYKPVEAKIVQPVDMQAEADRLRRENAALLAKKQAKE
jgi:hypothetical protein